MSTFSMQSSLITQEINTSYIYLSHRLYFSYTCTPTPTHANTHTKCKTIFFPQHKNFPKLSFQVSVIILFYNKAFECFLLKCRRSKTRHNAVQHSDGFSTSSNTMSPEGFSLICMNTSTAPITVPESSRIWDQWVG